MLPDDVLTRLSQLNRETVPPPVRCFSKPDAVESPASAWAVTEKLSSSLPAGREVETSWGEHYLIRRTLEEIWPDGNPWLKKIDSARKAVAKRDLHEELKQHAHHFPDRVLFLDLETCGFAGSMVFLIGLLHQHDGQIVLSQLLARDYSEEKPVLQTLWDAAAKCRVLVTFNGKSFDWPMVHDRSTLHHLGCDRRSLKQAAGEPLAEESADTDSIAGGCLNRQDRRPELIHCDLLHHARRRWKERLPNCKLQTLEQYVCGRRRHDDIPGRDIPNAYHEFVRTKDAWQMRSVLHHNALDLITLLQLSLMVNIDTE